MVAFVKIENFVLNLAHKKFNLGSDSLKVALVLTSPTAGTDDFFNDLTEIAAGNGYSAGGTAPSITSSAETSGTYKLVLADVVFTASGGAIANFRYPVLYDSTPGTAATNPLIGYWDYGSTVTVNNGETFTWDADPTNGILTIA